MQVETCLYFSPFSCWHPFSHYPLIFLRKWKEIIRPLTPLSFQKVGQSVSDRLRMTFLPTSTHISRTNSHVAMNIVTLAERKVFCLKEWRNTFQMGHWLRPSALTPRAGADHPRIPRPGGASGSEGPHRLRNEFKESTLLKCITLWKYAFSLKKMP